MRVALRGGGVRALLRDVGRDLADVGLRVVVRAGPLVEAVEHLGEPHHEPIIPVEGRPKSVFAIGMNEST